MASIVKAPQWARGGNPDMSVEGPPADPNTYASFVGEFAGRYCGRVQAIEVWNEQNLHYEWGNERLDAARYVRLLAAAYRAIKAACPSMIVVSGAPTPTGALPPGGDPRHDLPGANVSGGAAELLRCHRRAPKRFRQPARRPRSRTGRPGTTRGPRTSADSSFYFRNTMEQYRNIMVKYGDGDKRLWPTEFGWASTGNPFPGLRVRAPTTPSSSRASTSSAHTR